MKAQGKGAERRGCCAASWKDPHHGGEGIDPAEEAADRKCQTGGRGGVRKASAHRLRGCQHKGKREEEGD